MRFMKNLRSFIKSVPAVSGWLAYSGAIISCVCVLIMMFLITVDVLGRYLFNSPILGIDHISAYLLVALVFMGFAYAFKTEAHIKVDVITSRLPKMTEQRLELGVYIVGIMGTAIIFWHGLRMVLTSYKMGTKFYPGAFQVPAFIIQLFVPLGFGLLFLQMIIGLISKMRQRAE